jgi:hypothetical protein
VLPDGIFSYQNLGLFWRAVEWSSLVNFISIWYFYGHWINSKSNRNILWSTGTFLLVMVSMYVVPRKIWQPWSLRKNLWWVDPTLDLELTWVWKNCVQQRTCRSCPVLPSKYTTRIVVRLSQGWIPNSWPPLKLTPSVQDPYSERCRNLRYRKFIWCSLISLIFFLKSNYFKTKSIIVYLMNEFYCERGQI